MIQSKFFLNYWEVQVRLIDNDYKSVLDFSGCQPGMTTRFQSVAMPELHEEGKPIKVMFTLLSSVKLAA